MIIDPLKLAQTHNLKPISYAIILQRDDYLIAKIETENDPLVLKASTSPNHISMWDAKNCRLLHEAGLPVPAVYAAGEEPLSFAFLSWIEGEPLTVDSPIEAQIEAGRLLKRIHHIPNRPKYNRDYPFEAWMEGWLNVAMTYWEQQKSVTPQMIQNVWDGFHKLQPLLATRGNHFYLQDGRPDHFMVLNGKINGMIDLHDCQPGDGAMDLAVMGVLDEPLLERALIGYAADNEEKEALDELIPFYLFLRRLAAAEFHANYALGSPKVVEKSLALAYANPFSKQ